MAFIKENDLTEGLSGKFGKKMVFKVVKGVSLATRKSTAERISNDKQLLQQERFKLASNYAKAKLLDPIAKAEYTKRSGKKAFSTAYSAAMKDYMTTPDILDVKVADFKGALGSVIPIKVSDLWKTVKVKVEIRLVDDTVSEAGEATFTPGDVEWKYTTTKALASIAGCRVKVTAIDRPGNEGKMEVVLF